MTMCNLLRPIPYGLADILYPCQVPRTLFASAAVQLLQGMPRSTCVFVHPVSSASLRPLRPALASAIYRHVAKFSLAAAGESAAA